MSAAPRRTAPPSAPAVGPSPGPGLPAIVAVLVVGGFLLRAATVFSGIGPAWGFPADWPDRLRDFAADPRAALGGAPRGGWGPRALPLLLSGLWILWGWLVVSVALQLAAAAIEGVLGALLPHARWPRALRGLVDGLTLTLTRRATTGAAASLLGLTALRLGASVAGAAPDGAVVAPVAAPSAAPEGTAVAPVAAPIATSAATAPNGPAAEVAPATRLAVAAAGYRFGDATDGPVAAHLAVVTPSADLAALAAQGGLPWTAYRILHADGGLTPVGEVVRDPAALPAGYLVIGPGPGAAATLPLVPTGEPAATVDREGADRAALATAQGLTDAPLPAMIRGAGLITADPSRATGHVVVVASGDSLRGIAARETGDEAAWVTYQVLHADGSLTPATRIAPTPDLIRPGDVFLGPGPGGGGPQSVPVALAGGAAPAAPIAPVASGAPAATVPVAPPAVGGPTVAIGVVAGQTATVTLADPGLGELAVRSVATPRHGTVTATGSRIAYHSTGDRADGEQLVYIAETAHGQLVTGRLDVAIAAPPAPPAPALNPDPDPATPIAAPMPTVAPSAPASPAPDTAAPGRDGGGGATDIAAGPPPLVGVGAVGLVVAGTGLLARRRFRRNLAADAADPSIGRTNPARGPIVTAVVPPDEHARRSLGQATAVAILVAAAVDRSLAGWGLPAYTLLAAYERDHAALLVRAEAPHHRHELEARAPDLAAALRCQVVALPSGGEGDVELLLTRLQGARLTPGLDDPAPPFVPIFALPSGADVFGHYDLLGQIGVAGDQGEHVAQILATLLAELLALHPPGDLEPLLIGSPTALPVPELLGTAHWRTPPVDPADPEALLACIDAELRELHARQRRLDRGRDEARPLQEATRLLVIPELARCFRDIPPAIAQQVGNGLDQLAKLGIATGQRLLLATTAPLEIPARFWQLLDLTLTLPLANPAASLRMVGDDGATDLLRREDGRLIPRLRPGPPRTWARIAPGDFRGRVLTPEVQRDLMRAIVRLHGPAPIAPLAAPSGPVDLRATALPDHDARGQGLGVGTAGAAGARAAVAPAPARDDADTAAARVLAGQLARSARTTPPAATPDIGDAPVEDASAGETPPTTPLPLAAILRALGERERAAGADGPDTPAPRDAGDRADASPAASAPSDDPADPAGGRGTAAPETPAPPPIAPVPPTIAGPVAPTREPSAVATTASTAPGSSTPQADAPVAPTPTGEETPASPTIPVGSAAAIGMAAGTVAPPPAPPHRPVAPPPASVVTDLAALLTPAATASTSFLDAFADPRGGDAPPPPRPRPLSPYVEEGDEPLTPAAATGAAGDDGEDAAGADDDAASDRPLPCGASPPAVPPFAFRVLRTHFSCTFRGEPIAALTKHRRLAEVLLALAVCEPGTAHLGLLVDLIWPHAASQSAGAVALNKQMSLWYRTAGQILADAGLDRDPKAILGYRAKDQVYAFDPAYVYCDLHEVYRHCATLDELLRRRTLAAADLTAALATMAELDRCWTGEFVAHGVPDWLNDPVRNFSPEASVRTRIARLRGALAAALVAVGRHEEALILHRRAYAETAETPHAERNIEHLLACYVALDDARRHRQAVEEYRATQLALVADDELAPPTDDELFSPHFRQLLVAHAAAFARGRDRAPDPA
jgi:hypothetical protein